MAQFMAECYKAISHTDIGCIESAAFVVNEVNASKTVVA
jgi:hypothetical protein